MGPAVILLDRLLLHQKIEVLNDTSQVFAALTIFIPAAQEPVKFFNVVI